MASGTVKAFVSVNGSPSPDLSATVSVSNRAWKWVRAQHWSYSRNASPNCETRPYYYGSGVLLGWTVHKGGCESSPLTPDPLVTTDGFTLQEVPSGPNAHLWYVSNVTYRMDMESNINASINPGIGPFHTLSATDKTACKKAKLTVANHYDYSALCRKVDMQKFTTAIWDHEGYGPGGNLAGHMGQLEIYALFDEGDPYKSLEKIFTDGQLTAFNAAWETAKSVNFYLNQHAASHENIGGAWCDNTWQWNTATNGFTLAPPLGVAGRCI